MRAYASALIEKHALRLDCSATMDNHEVVLNLVNENLRHFYLTESQQRGITLLAAELCQRAGNDIEAKLKFIPENAQQFTLVQLRLKAK